MTPNDKIGSSIWHDNPETYLVIKAVWSSIISTFYPFSFFCVLKKSPENFGSLKWFLLLHLICISISWVANFLLIDYFYFVSTLVVRIDGFLTYFMDSWTLYQISYITYGISLSSSQLIFCNRVFLIVNMYQTWKSPKQKFFEVFVYIFVGFLPLATVPVVWKLTPNQQRAKEAIVNNFKIYPECIFEDNSVIICNPINNCGIYLAIMNLLNVVISTSIIFSATHIAYKLLSKRMLLKSEKTKKMHKKFNQRTFLQAIVVFLFAMFPLFLANIALLLDWNIECLSYIIDFLRESQPNASLLTLFLFYDPYQLYMITVLRCVGKRVKTSVLMVKSAKVSVDAKSVVPTFVNR